MNFVSVLIKQAGFAPNSMENQNSTKHFPIRCRLVKVVVLQCLLFSRLKYPPHLQKGFISWHVDCILSISREFAILRTCAFPPVQRYVSKNLFTGFVAQVCAWDVTRRLPMALESSHFQAVKNIGHVYGCIGCICWIHRFSQITKFSCWVLGFRKKKSIYICQTWVHNFTRQVYGVQFHPESAGWETHLAECYVPVLTETEKA